MPPSKKKKKWLAIPIRPGDIFSHLRLATTSFFYFHFSENESLKVLQKFKNLKVLQKLKYQKSN
jgi:hypothetical protein